MHFLEIVRDSLMATLVGICGKKIYCKVKNWYNHDKDIDINSVHIDFIPTKTEDEVVIITKKGEQPELFKFYSKVK